MIKYEKPIAEIIDLTPAEPVMYDQDFSNEEWEDENEEW